MSANQSMTASGYRDFARTVRNTHATNAAHAAFFLEIAARFEIQADRAEQGAEPLQFHTDPLSPG